MFWILMTVFIVGIGIGIVLPAFAIVFFKIKAQLSGKKITCRQIFELIGY